MAAKTHLPPAVARWLRFERFFNDRRANRRYFVSFREASRTIAAAYRPETAAEWNLDVAYVPARESRVIGPLVSQLRRTLGLTIPAGTVPVFIHPQSRRLYQQLIAARGLARTPIVVTPTASYRSLLAWHEERPQAPMILKLSLDARFVDVSRVIPERDIVRATLVSAILSSIPAAVRRRLGFDFFPASFDQSGRKTLVPLFALTSAGPKGEPPLLVGLIRRSRRSPEAFLISKVIKPYVRALAYLLFHEGLYVEGHSQNILLEMGAKGNLTGRVVLRDLSGTAIDPAFRRARGRPMPRLSRLDLEAAIGPTHRRSASYAVEMFGLRDAVWKLDRSVRAYVPSLDRRRLKEAYLMLYQQAAVDALRMRPAIRRGLAGLALDEAISLYVLRYRRRG